MVVDYSLQEEDYNQFLDFLCGDIETPPLPYVMPEGYDDTGQETCKLFMKTGSCRFFERCKLAHHSPVLSQTLLVPNFFSHFLLQESLRDEYDMDLGLEYEKSDLQKEFVEFFEDVLPEFRKHGKVIQFKVCCNLEAHLRGNVYIQYDNIRSAVEAFRTFNARFYNGRQISLRFIKIDSWRAAICWSFLNRHCAKGGSCNYLHVFRNPTKEFVVADRDFKDSAAYRPSAFTLEQNRPPIVAQNTLVSNAASVGSTDHHDLEDTNSQTHNFTSRKYYHTENSSRSKMKSDRSSSKSRSPRGTKSPSHSGRKYTKSRKSADHKTHKKSTSLKHKKHKKHKSKKSKKAKRESHTKQD